MRHSEVFTSHYQEAIPLALNASHLMAALASIACLCLIPVLPAAAEEALSADAAAETSTPQIGWNTDGNGRITYRFEDGTAASGETEINGFYYLFSFSGTLKTDWQTVNGKRYYFEPATGEPQFGWVDYFGSLYYVTKTDGKLTGSQEIDGVTYEFDEDGVLQETILTAPPEETTVPTEAITEAPTTSPAVTAEATAPAAEPVPVIDADPVIAPIGAAAPVTAVPVETTVPPVITAIETTAAVTAASSEETTAPAATTVSTAAATTAPAAAAEPAPVEIPPETPADTEVSFEVPAPTSTKSAFELSVPDYKQKDPAWVNARLGGETIGKYGCLVTAMAMLHSYTAGPCTPVDMTQMLQFTNDGSLKKWDDITALGYAVETYSTPVTAEILDALYRHLCDGKPVVLGSKGSWQHYVVVSGYTGDGLNHTAEDFVIHDPGYPDRVTLADHLRSFGTLYKLIYAP